MWRKEVLTILVSVIGGLRGSKPNLECAVNALAEIQHTLLRYDLFGVPEPGETPLRMNLQRTEARLCLETARRAVFQKRISDALKHLELCAGIVRGIVQ